MNKRHAIVCRNEVELAEVLGLPARESVEIDVRVRLNEQIIRIVRRKRLTHAQLAKAAGTSRTRVTAILNRNTHDVSTDLLLRIAAALGYTAKLTLVPSKSAA